MHKHTLSSKTVYRYAKTSENCMPKKPNEKCTCMPKLRACMCSKRRMYCFVHTKQTQPTYRMTTVWLL